MRRVSVPAREGGFTLVEMLIALAIFAVIAGGALMLLQFSVDAEAASRTKTQQIASEIGRASCRERVSPYV